MDNSIYIWEEAKMYRPVTCHSTFTKSDSLCSNEWLFLKVL